MSITPASTQIKVSGITQPDDARLAADLGVAMVACVFNAKSPRFVTMSTAWAIRRALPPHVSLVGIFVDAPRPLVQQVVHHCALDHAQLFGHETRADVEAIHPHAFKAVTVDQPAAVDRVVRTHLGVLPGRAVAPAMLVHLTRSASMDWDCLAHAASRVPLLLASSALSPANIGDAIRQARPWGVDVWDAVEAKPGRVDPRRLAALVAAVRAADQALATGADG